MQLLGSPQVLPIGARVAHCWGMYEDALTRILRYKMVVPSIFPVCYCVHIHVTSTLYQVNYASSAFIILAP